jgi:pyridoxamine 5'-phosphate oxidase
MDAINLAALRQNYTLKDFSETEAHDDPFQQFANWFKAVINTHVKEPNIMALATATPDGFPSARVVLLKGFDADGFTFFTNYESRKGQELAENPRAALLFCWMQLERQVRIEGIVEKVNAEESRKYFQSRPKNSQLGAWASPQSRIISDRQILEKNMSELEIKWKDAAILPCPEFWGGYKVVPVMFEFWQGRENRLHDRVQYNKKDGQWVKQRLAP